MVYESFAQRRGTFFGQNQKSTHKFWALVTSKDGLPTARDFTTNLLKLVANDISLSPLGCSQSFVFTWRVDKYGNNNHPTSAAAVSIPTVGSPWTLY